MVAADDAESAELLAGVEGVEEPCGLVGWVQLDDSV